MEPIPETAEAVSEFGPFGDDDLLEMLRAWAEEVRVLVPQCVGLSLASMEHGVSFTMVATDEEIAILDGIQYLDGGPCVDGVKAERVIEHQAGDLLGEADWRLFSRATAEAGIASTLTLPVLKDAEVVGSVNLYASTPDAFTGHHTALASIFGAWAAGAVANADLSFSTRQTAEQAPRVLKADLRVHIAVGVLMEMHHVGPDSAQEMMRDAALRAGVTMETLAEALIAQASQEEREADDRDR